MSVVIVTGASGLVGSSAVRRFSDAGFDVVGIDNDQRAAFFGEEASTRWMRGELESSVNGYSHHDVDIRDEDALVRIFSTHDRDIACIVHAAAQPSHDWARGHPETDFDINARATLSLLERARRYCPEACFIFMSTNKVYGDSPNRLPLVEKATRWELDADHPFFEHGIDESMSVDATTHSLFGVSKLAADVAVQEYSRYFHMNTVCFRAGCVTGPAHSGTRLHGFLSYLVRCAVTGTEYTILGYEGKQVRDNIHVDDLTDMFLHFVRDPRPGEIYNVGGGRTIHCSLLEAVELVQQVTGREMRVTHAEQNRVGDHIWYVSDTRKFESHYPSWRRTYELKTIVGEIHQGLLART